MHFPSQSSFSFSPPRLTFKRKFDTCELCRNLEAVYLAPPKILPMEPCRAGQEREPCEMAMVSEKWRAHSSNCSSLLKQNRSVELPRGLHKAESSTPQERRKEPVKRQSHSSLFMVRDNCLVVCLFSRADKVNHTLYLHSRWEIWTRTFFCELWIKANGAVIYY